jgi:hypothetical protein
MKILSLGIRESRFYTALQIGIFSALFAYIYVQSVGIDPASIIANQATFHVDSNFRLRFLLPMIFYHLLPTGAPDTTTFRMIAAFVAVAGCFMLLRPYAMRITGEAPSSLLFPVFFILLLLHYTGFKVLNVYYVYDMPAIAFYMGVFLLLTSEDDIQILIGVILAVILSLNRETIIFAALHTIGYQLAQRREKFDRKTLTALTPAIAALFGILLLRLTMSHLLDIGGIGNSISRREGDDYRFVAYAKRLFTSSQIRFQLFTLGAGLIVWLPLTFRRLPKMEKWLLLLTVPGLIMLNIGGNLVELRMYNECVPLITLLFTRFVTLGTARPESRSS